LKIFYHDNLIIYLKIYRVVIIRSRDRDPCQKEFSGLLIHLKKNAIWGGSYIASLIRCFCLCFCICFCFFVLVCVFVFIYSTVITFWQYFCLFLFPFLILIPEFITLFLARLLLILFYYTFIIFAIKFVSYPYIFLYF